MPERATVHAINQTRLRNQIATLQARQNERREHLARLQHIIDVNDLEIANLLAQLHRDTR